jgi:hypothetical protein
MALPSRQQRRPRIHIDEEGAGIEHGLRERQQHIGEIDPGDDVHAVALHHLVCKLAADIGLGLIVALNQFDRASAELIANALEAEFESVEQFLSETAGRTGKGRNESDLDRFLRSSRRCKRRNQ